MGPLESGMLAGRVFGLYLALLDGRFRVFTERVGQRLALEGVYFDLFHASFRFYDTTVSDEG